MKVIHISLAGIAGRGALGNPFIWLQILLIIDIALFSSFEDLIIVIGWHCQNHTLLFYEFLMGNFRKQFGKTEKSMLQFSLFNKSNSKFLLHFTRTDSFRTKRTGVYENVNHSEKYHKQTEDVHNHEQGLNILYECLSRTWLCFFSLCSIMLIL